VSSSTGAVVEERRAEGWTGQQWKRTSGKAAPGTKDLKPRMSAYAGERVTRDAGIDSGVSTYVRLVGRMNDGYVVMVVGSAVRHEQFVGAGMLG
jgi:hypothetical protein